MLCPVQMFVQYRNSQNRLSSPTNGSFRPHDTKEGPDLPDGPDVPDGPDAYDGSDT